MGFVGRAWAAGDQSSTLKNRGRHKIQRGGCRRRDFKGVWLLEKSGKFNLRVWFKAGRGRYMDSRRWLFRGNRQA